MQSIKEKAETMLQHVEIVTLTSINKDGYPRPVPMSKIKSEGYSIVWMSTGKNSLKTKDFLTNPKSGLCYTENGNSVVLTGEVDIVTDETIKQHMWQDWFIDHFPKGISDPNYILLKFKGKQATFWIDGKFIHRKI